MEEAYQVMGLIAIVVLLVFYLVLYRKMGYLTKRYQVFMKGGNGVSLENSLEILHDEIQVVGREVRMNRERTQELAAVLDTAMRGVGVVRFNAFRETGSDLSFAVAFLDAEKNGVVISSIYGREESRTYAKPLKGGQSCYPLGSEEQEAICKAIATLQASSLLTGRKENR